VFLDVFSRVVVVDSQQKRVQVVWWWRGEWGAASSSSALPHFSTKPETDTYETRPPTRISQASSISHYAPVSLHDSHTFPFEPQTCVACRLYQFCYSCPSCGFHREFEDAALCSHLKRRQRLPHQRTQTSEHHPSGSLSR
jgi:hypothetical protein